MGFETEKTQHETEEKQHVTMELRSMPIKFIKDSDQQ